MEKGAPVVIYESAIGDSSLGKDFRRSSGTRHIAWLRRSNTANVQIQPQPISCSKILGSICELS
jgi:hypothetical protein